MKQKTIFITAAALLVLAFIASMLFYNSRQSAQATAHAAQNQEALSRFHAPTIGSADAPVHIVEFLDPACETCSAFYPMVKELMAAHPGKIRLSVRYAPFHQGSDQVVKILEAARKQGKYWETLEALLASQSYWVKHHAAQVDAVWNLLDGLGMSLGLNKEQIRNDMNAPEIARLIAQDIADTKTLNVTKTPEFFVNGKPLPSFGYNQLKTLVEDELAGAKAK